MLWAQTSFNPGTLSLVFMRLRLALCFAIFLFKLVESSQIKDHKTTTKSDDLYRSSPSVSGGGELDDEFDPSLSYEQVFNLFELQYSARHHPQLDITKPSNPYHLSYIIFYNFFYSHSLTVDRTLNQSNRGQRTKFNGEILYKIMKNRPFMKFIGYENCYRIMRKVFEHFKPVVHLSTARKGIGLINSQLADFLEFVLNELAPRYTRTPDDLNFNAKDKYELEYPALIVLVERSVKMSCIVSFKGIDLLRLIMQRYSSIWIPELTEEFIKTTLKYAHGDDYIFRQVLTVLVKSVPDYFVLKDFMKQYSLFASDPVSNNLHLVMAKMAPIFRALMFIDEIETIYKYLESYWHRIGMERGAHFRG